MSGVNCLNAILGVVFSFKVGNAALFPVSTVHLIESLRCGVDGTPRVFQTSLKDKLPHCLLDPMHFGSQRWSSNGDPFPRNNPEEGVRGLFGTTCGTLQPTGRGLPAVSLRNILTLAAAELNWND